MKRKRKTITLQFNDYIIRGTADLTLWGGGNACIEMNPFHLKKITKKTLKENLNDARFGVESINGAICEIYENYEGKEVYLKTVYVGEVSDHTLDVHESR